MSKTGTYPPGIPRMSWCASWYSQNGKTGGTHLKDLAKIEKAHLLILDDFGVQPLDAGARALLLDIIEDRHAKRSTIVTSQLPVAKWHDVIGEKTVADAILDRIVHQAVRIEL